VRKLLVLIAAFVVLGSSQASAHNLNLVYPANHRPLGASYSTWAERWGRYAFGVPNARNPLIFASNCDVSIQMSHGALLLPASGGGKQVVSCDVPAHTPLFLTPGGDDSVVGVDGATRAEARRQDLRKSLRHTKGLFVSIDAEQVRHVDRFRTHTPFFRIFLYNHNIVGAPKRGTYQMIVGGWFFMIRGLVAGDHTIIAHDVYPSPDGPVSATTRYKLHAAA
jgi:hypothetical protein